LGTDVRKQMQRYMVNNVMAIVSSVWTPWKNNKDFDRLSASLSKSFSCVTTNSICYFRLCTCIMKQYHKKHISHYHKNYGLKYKQPPTSRCISHGIIEGLKPSSFKLILISIKMQFASKKHTMHARLFPKILHGMETRSLFFYKLGGETNDEFFVGHSGNKLYLFPTHYLMHELILPYQTATHCILQLQLRWIIIVICYE
jgi:hypothetical protein